MRHTIMAKQCMFCRRCAYYMPDLRWSIWFNRFPVSMEVWIPYYQATVCENHDCQKKRQELLTHNHA